MHRGVVLGNYPYNLGDEIRLQAYNEKKDIRSLGMWAAGGILGYVVIQNLVSIFLVFVPTLYSLYFEVPLFQSAANIIISVLSMIFPFALSGRAAKKRFGTHVFAFEKPKDIPFTVTAIGFGVFVCLAGNYVTSLFVNAVDSVGVELSAPEFSTPTNVFSRIIYAVAISVVPALTEEFAIRGAVMQPLRRYGDRFAIIASSFVFAILHGNLIQAPFAFIAGFALGYTVCVTGSIWTGVAIHFINNFYSVVTEFLIEDIADPKNLDKAYYMITGVLYVISIACSVAFVIALKSKKKPVRFVALSKARMWKAYIINPPMIIAIIIMIVITAQYINLK